MKFKIFFLAIAAVVSFSSCGVFNPSVMLRTKSNYQYDTVVRGADSSYRIAPDDILNVRILTNDGEALIDVTGNVQQQSQGQGDNPFGGIPIMVDYDGTSKFPIIDRVLVQNLTRREAENKLEEMYSRFFKNPFVTVNISNRRVIIFPGTGNNAQVVNLTGDRMNLLEALAKVGGIANTGKAKKVKLIRGDLKNPQVFKINLATLEGMKEADLSLQSGDIIYVEPYEDAAVIFNKTVLPYLTGLGAIASVVTSVALIITLTK